MGTGWRGLSRWWWLGPLIAASALAAVLVWRGGGPADGARAGRGGAVGVARRETRPTLDPARFVGKARLAHQVARDIPDVLDQLYCYCECDKTIGHKSLLSCFTDGHAAT
ncbi:MAG TPA: hypothetical protein DDZ42_01375 [Candidatus Rokubacteria bacterium]|nr:hypothetical protein [Candidatus Rokubacteria bacterium]